MHACVQCAVHWPDPPNAPASIRFCDNSIARIAEAEHEGWLGEAEGLRISLIGAKETLTQIDRRPAPTAFDLSIPALEVNR